MGRWGLPALKGAAGEEGLGAMATPPVSVCHQVSTRSHLPPPTTWCDHVVNILKIINIWSMNYFLEVKFVFLYVFFSLNPL